MKRITSRRFKPSDSFDIICRLCDKLRDQYGEVRYVERIEHNGSQWSVYASWERFEGGEWIAFDLPLLNY